MDHLLLLLQAAVEDAVDRHRADGQGIEHAHAVARIQQAQVEDVATLAEAAAEGDHRETQHGRHEGQHRGHPEQHGAGVRGDQVLLEEELDAVGRQLRQAEQAPAAEQQGPVRADAVLDHGAAPTLAPGEQRRQGQRPQEHDEHLGDHPEGFRRQVQQTGQRFHGRLSGKVSTGNPKLQVSREGVQGPRTGTRYSASSAWEKPGRPGFASACVSSANSVTSVT